MSANSHWPEIEDALLPEQRPEHCPDLICYVFHAKWNEFIQNIKGGCFENSVWFRHQSRTLLVDRRGKMAAIMKVEGEVVKVAMIAVGVGAILVVDIEVVIITR